jgi:Mn-dependent DtxR family transcriptional regulator
MLYSRYALTETGEELAGQLYEFQQSVHRFLKSNQVPHIPQTIKYISIVKKSDLFQIYNFLKNIHIVLLCFIFHIM